MASSLAGTNPAKLCSAARPTQPSAARSAQQSPSTTTSRSPLNHAHPLTLARHETGPSISGPPLRPPAPSHHTRRTLSREILTGALVCVALEGASGGAEGGSFDHRTLLGAS